MRDRLSDEDRRKLGQACARALRAIREDQEERCLAHRALMRWPRK